MLLVHATEPSGSPQSDPLRIDELSQKRYAHPFQKIISASRRDEVITEKIVITGNPVKITLNQAKHRKTDLIVVGTQSRRGMKRLMLGSVAEAVVRRAACPVFTVRTQARNPLDVSTGTRRFPPRSSAG